MLVLTRSKDETIHIGNDITIKIVRTGQNVRLGIEAPPDFKIWRGELSPEGEQSVAAGPEVEPLPAA